MSLAIAVYSHYFTPEIGAPSARLYDMSREWIRAGHKVDVVTCFPNHPTGEIYPGYEPKLHMSEVLDEIKVHRHWTYVTPNRGFLKKSVGHASYFPSALLWSNRKVRRPSVTVGSSPTFFAAMAAARKASQTRVPFIMEVRDLWPAAFVELGVLRRRWLIWLLEQWELALYRRADAVVTVTEAFRRLLVGRGIAPEKVRTIPNGADVEFWAPKTIDPVAPNRHARPGEFTVLYIGAHGISQGLAQVLAAAELLRDFPEIKFLFVGEGAEKAKLIAQAAERGLKNVQFHAPVGKETVREFYAAAGVCLVPLRNIPIFDTFIPSKMFEMMAMARPLLASLRGEAADILSRSGGALVVEPENSQQLANGIRALYHDPDRRCKMGVWGREFVVQNYSRRALAQSYLQLMNNLIVQRVVH